MISILIFRDDDKEHRNTKPSRSMKEAFCSKKLLYTFPSPSVFEFPVSIFWSKMAAIGGDMVGPSNFLPQNSASSFHPKIPSWLGFLVWQFQKILHPSFCPWVTVSRFFCFKRIKGVIQGGFLLRFMGFLTPGMSSTLTLLDPWLHPRNISAFTPLMLSNQLMFNNRIREDRRAQETFRKDKPNKRTQSKMSFFLNFRNFFCLCLSKRPVNHLDCHSWMGLVSYFHKHLPPKKTNFPSWAPRTSCFDQNKSHGFGVQNTATSTSMPPSLFVFRVWWH